MKPSRAISLLLVLGIATFSVALILVFGLIEVGDAVYISIIIFGVGYLSTFIVMEHLFYRDINEVVRLFNELRKGIRPEEVSINRKKMRLPTFKKLYKELYSYALKRQRKIDKLNRIAAFRKEFIADVSHELKTPIFAAQGFVHTLLDGADEDEAVRKRFLKKAAKSLDGLDLLVHDLLTLSHIEIGETKMQFEYFDLKTLAEEVLEQLESRKAQRTIQVISDEDKSVIVYADWLRIKQALINLISNAIKYSEEDGNVSVRLSDDKDFVELAIQDDGQGIPEEDLNRVFERFYRVDKSRSREKGGTGLGLAIVKHIVEGHHSKMEVESIYGEGSTFKFLLPKGKESLKRR